MLFRNGDNFLEILPAEQVPKGQQCAGDIRFSVRVRFSGFTADSSAWVEATALAAFIEQLRVLDRERKGAAAFDTMPTGELRLEVRPYDRAGHMAAFGKVGSWCYDGVEGPHWCEVAFGIPFCPSELPGLVREASSW